eukprot:CAMPEP_0118670758 /NCGR_PEP_ID=MMETSP0785-20121206/21634_1 /TAXON_ID=91992 /ORGANISM="Bolidomonas pacifica, Strain CCMP 1866" /LENGTH=289 /DNA_ID=CAMNT_0006565587 /DNA_START=234 /DNA_END=1100 /DNA_ORIENTATION=-
MQERLMALDLYANQEYAISMHLTNNYRSHESILAVSSALFYQSKLRPMADDAKKNRAIEWEELEGRRFPLLFFDSSEGEHLSQIDNPSFFNRHEIEVCVSFVKRLMASPKLELNYSDIAIITPFRAQVLRLRNELRKAGAGGVGVGQIEDYQGGEKPIVIVSTVLTETEARWQGENGDSSLGFMRDAKKFNVALSRAESLCLFIGKIDFLLESDNNYFAALVKHCEANNAIAGDPTSTHATTSGGVDLYGEGLDALLSYVETAGLGAGSEKDRLEMSMRGYSSCEGDRW